MMHASWSRRRLACCGVLIVGALLLSGCLRQVGGTRPFELTTGDCFNDQYFGADEERLVLRVEVVPCEQPHQWEVTTVVPVPGGDAYPDRRVFLDVVADECERALEDRASGSVDELASTGRFPSRNSWNLGYRWVICLVESADGSPRTGSVAHPTATPG